jgi:ribonuclease P protein component
MVVRPLKGYRSFEEVLRSGRRVTSGPLLLAVLPNPTDLSQAYVGVGVPKRVARKAVVRNRIKRLMRVAMRSAYQRHHAELAGRRIVCLWRQGNEHPASIHLSAVEHHVEQGMQKLTRKGSR